AHIPHHTYVRRGPAMPAQHRDLVGNHEGRVETDAELADQIGIGLGVATHRFQKAARAGAGDGADVGHDLVAGHADAVVADGDGARVFVPVDVDVEFAVATEQVGLLDRLEAQLVAGIGCV